MLLIESSMAYCPVCNRISECTYEFETQFYCSETCVKEQMVLINQVSNLCSITGLKPVEIKETLALNNWSLDDFTENIDDYLEALSSGSSIPLAIVKAFENAGVYNTLSENLAILKTGRGGTNFSGFVFEHLHAAEATVSGTPTAVMGNNGIADFFIIQPDGKRILGQAKTGFQRTADFQKYKGQTLVVDKGNTQLIERAKLAGLEVIESDVSLKKCKTLSDLMKLESKILNVSNASLTSKIYALNQSGIASAKVGGAAGAGFSIGSNIVEVFSGDRDLVGAGKVVARDTAIATASSYAIGAAAATPIGATIAGTVSSAGSILAGTTVGGGVVAGAGAITGAVTTATAAVTGAASAATTAVAGTAVGTVVTGAATAATTAVAGTAVGTAVTGIATAAAGTAVGGAAIAGAAAVGAAAVAAAPIIAVGAVAGGVFTLGKKLFGR